MNKNKNLTVEVPYVHHQNVHNLDSPLEIVKVLVSVFNPSTVVDVGCGIGTFVHAFQQAGVKEVKGIDGSWVDKKQLSQYMNTADFIEADLQKPLFNNEKFDMAVSLEVAEHLEEQYADTFIANLTSLSDVIVFSAAVPGQPGQNHINLQTIDYWEKKFNFNNYKVYDVLRPVFWDNKKIYYWYKQNMFLVIKNGKDVDLDKLYKLNSLKIMHIIHPEMLDKYVQRINNVEELKLGVRYYFGLFLKSLKKYFFN